MQNIAILTSELVTLEMAWSCFLRCMWQNSSYFELKTIPEGLSSARESSICNVQVLVILMRFSLTAILLYKQKFWSRNISLFDLQKNQLVETVHCLSSHICICFADIVHHQNYCDETWFTRCLLYNWNLKQPMWVAFLVLHAVNGFCSVAVLKYIHIQVLIRLLANRTDGTMLM